MNHSSLALHFLEALINFADVHQEFNIRVVVTLYLHPKNDITVFYGQLKPNSHCRVDNNYLYRGEQWPVIKLTQ